MEKLPIEEKDTPPALLPFPLSFPGFPQNVPMLPPLLSKKLKPKQKIQKGFISTLRIGDWVCIICHNLNFSFRNECNRCQRQTKEQNQIQSLFLPESLNIHDNLPFTDIANLSLAAKPLEISTTIGTNKSTPTGKYSTACSVSKLSMPDESNEIIDSNHELSFNKGFENMLLVTPRKCGKNVHMFKEYSDSGLKELPPYKSPQHLPSVSPMLKRVFGFKESESDGVDVKGNHKLSLREEFDKCEEKDIILGEFNSKWLVNDLKDAQSNEETEVSDDMDENGESTCSFRNLNL